MKMNFKKTGLAIALAAVSSTAVQAATITIPAITPVTSAVERVALTEVVGADAVFTVAAIVGDKGLDVGDKVRFTIAGAKFNRTNVAAKGAGAITWSDSGAATGPFALDTTDTVLTATVTTGTATDNTAAVITLVGSDAAKLFDLTGVTAGTSVTITADVTRSLLGSDTVIHPAVTSTTVFTVGKLYTAATATATTGTITVADDYKKVDGVLTKLGASVTTTAADAGALTTATGTAIVTLAGDMSGVASIADAGLVGTACNASGVTQTVTAGEYYVDAAAGEAYTCLANAAAKAGTIVSTPTYTFNGTTALSAGSYTTTADYVVGTADTFTASNSGSIINTTLTRNGSAFSVNASGPLNSVKITDLSGSLTTSTGSIAVVAYDVDGTEVSGTVTIPALPSNGTVTIAMSDLTTAYPAAIRFDFAVQSSKVLASNVKKASTGTTLTVYTNGTTGAL